MIGRAARIHETTTTAFIAGVASFFALVVTAMFGEREALPVPEASMERVFASERATASEAGLRPVEDGRIRGRDAQRTVRLSPGECMSVIVGLAGMGYPEPLRIVDDRTGAVLPGERSTGTSNVRHMQWCSLRGGSYTVTVRAPEPPRLAILTGVPIAGRLPLPRARPPGEMQAELRDELVTVAIERSSSSWLVPVVHLATTAPPMLLPSTPATRAALREAMLLDAEADLSTVPLTAAPEAVARRALADETAPAPAAHPRHRRHDEPSAPAPTLHPVSADDATATLRVLGLGARIVAVVDPGALGASCAALVFARSDATQASVLRVDVPGWIARVLVATDGISRDVVCPADGLRVYARTDVSDATTTVFAVGAVPASDAAVGAPSPWRGETAQHSLVARLEAECERDARGCIALADLARVTGFRAPHPTEAEALRRACDRQHAESCGRYGDSLLATEPHDVAAATSALRRGCELGDALTCAVLATHERLGDVGVTQDLAASFAHYSRACALGSSPACASRDTMRLLHLPE